MKKTLVTIVALFVATLLCCVSCNENNVPAARVENIPVFIEDTSLKIAVIAPFYQGNASGRGKDSKELAYRIFKDIEYALAQIMSTSDQVKYIPVDSYDIRDSYERYQAFYEREPYRNKAYAAEFAKEVHRKTGTNLLIYGLFEYGWDKIELKLAVARKDSITGRAYSVTGYKNDAARRDQILYHIKDLVERELR